MTKKIKRLLLFDSSALVYRAFYALPPLTDKKGQVVNAVYGFASTIINIIKSQNPTHIIFAFDSPKPTYRKKKYKEYKATREKAPDELYAQIPLSKGLVKGFNFLSFEEPGFEADDIIGTLSQKFLEESADNEVVIATGDLDTLQLVGPRIKVFVLSRGINEAKIYDEKGVRDRFGLDPDQMNDFKALRGDASDNIKGVKGIGEKTAVELLQKYKTLERIYENLEKLTPRLKQILLEEKDQAILSKELVTLHLDIPLKIKWEDSVLKQEQFESGKKHLKNFSFTSLVNRIEKWQEETRKMGHGTWNHPSSFDKIRVAKGQDMKHETHNTQQNITKKPVVVENLDQLQINGAKDIVLWLGKSVLGEGLGLGLGIIENGNIQNSFFVKKELIPDLIKIISKDTSVWVFDFKEIFKKIFPNCLAIENVKDLKLEAYLIQPPLVRKFNLKEVAWFFAKIRLEESKKQLSLLGGMVDNGASLKKIQESLETVATIGKEIQRAFREQNKFQKESHFIEKIFPSIRGKIRERSLEFVYESIEKPLSEVLGLIEMSGVKIDLDLLGKLRKKNQKELEKLKREIFRISGREFNLDSPSQLADILFEDLKISSKGNVKGKAGHFSTKAEILERLEGAHPVISFLLDYREQRKFQTTYLDVIPNLVDRVNGRLFTSFEQTGTATGRLSSNNPNLQNIPLEPIDKENNLGLRNVFVAEEGFSLLSLDYSQIEIRLAAYLVGEEKLIAAFERGEDIHRKTASLVNDISPEEVTNDLRNAAKALNFGIIYGMSPFGFAKSAKMSEWEARNFVKNYLEEFPQIARYMEEAKKFVREFGYVETIFGRRRYVPEADSPNQILRQAGERMAINMPLQGTAADIMKMTLVKVNDLLERKYVKQGSHPLERDVRILLSIHDEIILEVQNNLVEKVTQDVKGIMENVATEILPLKVSVEIGKNWGEI